MNTDLRTSDTMLSATSYEGVPVEDSLTEYQKQLPYRVEVLIKALGTMILMPEYETSTDTFQKKYAGNIQRPILEGDRREQTLDVLMELINAL